uniref:Uncharacterized protein n=1 Tax=Cacopsylla melanoneura TaxID=428564 RepID=A0A8D8MA46_9HEMI
MISMTLATSSVSSTFSAKSGDLSLLKPLGFLGSIMVFCTLVILIVSKSSLFGSSLFRRGIFIFIGISTAISPSGTIFVTIISDVAVITSSLVSEDGRVLSPFVFSLVLGSFSGLV